MVDPLDGQAEVPFAIPQERRDATTPARIRVQTVRVHTWLDEPSVPEHRQAGGACLSRDLERRP